MEAMEKLRSIPSEELRHHFAELAGWEWDEETVTSPDRTSRRRFWGNPVKIDRLNHMLPDIKSVPSIWPYIEDAIKKLHKPSRRPLFWDAVIDLISKGEEEPKAFVIAYCLLRI